MSMDEVRRAIADLDRFTKKEVAEALGCPHDTAAHSIDRMVRNGELRVLGACKVWHGTAYVYGKVMA